MKNPYFQVHKQHIPNEVWQITNLTGQYPMITAYDEHNIILVPEETQVNTREITLRFRHPVSGTVQLVSEKGLQWASLWSTVESIEQEKEMKRAEWALHP